MAALRKARPAAAEVKVVLIIGVSITVSFSGGRLL